MLSHYRFPGAPCWYGICIHSDFVCDVWIRY